MEQDSVERTVAELSAMFEGDGAALRVTGVDPSQGTVQVALSLDDVSCADCVLPPDRLHEVLLAALRRDTPGVTRLELSDPREVAAPGAGPLASVVTVLDPTGEVPAGNPDPGPAVGPLAGRRVGFRVDVLWPAWDVVVDEWSAELERHGAVATRMRRAQGLTGQEGDRHQADYDAFVGGVDVVVSGLGNCGSCTSWSVRDGLTALNRGLPAVVAVTEQFETLARRLSADLGRPGLRLTVLPFSAHVLSDDEIRAAARERFPALLELLGADVPVGVA